MKKCLKPLLFVLLVAAGTIFVCLPCRADDAAKDGFVSLFDGKTLDGWKGNPAIWSVEDGCITGVTGEKGSPNFLTYNQFLVSKEKFQGNFVLEFDIKLSVKGNSGVQYHSWVNTDPAKPYSVSGYQGDFDGAATYSGIVYGENFRGILAQRGTISQIGGNHQPKETARFVGNEELKSKIKIEDWNVYQITFKDYVIVHKINGALTSVLIDNDSEVRRNEGVLAIQAHVGPPMKVQIKNIRIKKLDAGK
ncbi:MAG: DUF1080 domain-containing protein [Planctomycetaceae bacterium]|jgi:hypothetical protein|nr:DUF1080 domain-containing protein [Planctomycetaceae bacterium]